MEHWTLDLRVVSSGPAWGVEIKKKKIIVYTMLHIDLNTSVSETERPSAQKTMKYMTALKGTINKRDPTDFCKRTL